MNKLISKIVGVALGLTLAVGTGVAVVANSNSATKAEAADQTVSWTATAANNLGAQISSVNGTDTGTISTGSYSWNYTRTLVNLKSGKSDNISFQGSTWIQLGSSNALESLSFTTSNVPGTIKSVSVTAATAGTHKVTVSVGNSTYLNAADLTTYSNTASATNPNPSNCVVTGTGSASGTITISIASSATTTNKAMLIRSISVTYEENSSITCTGISASLTNTSKVWKAGETVLGSDVTVYADDVALAVTCAGGNGECTQTFCGILNAQTAGEHAVT